MKYFLIFTLLVSGLSFAHANEKELRVIEAQRENLTAFSYKKRESAIFILKKVALNTDSRVVKLETIDALQEHAIDFMTGGTAIMSLELIQDIALGSYDIIVATKAIEILQSKLEFSISRSARVRNTAAKLMVNIASLYADEGLNEMVYDAFLPHVNSNLDQLSKTAREFID